MRRFISWAVAGSACVLLLAVGCAGDDTVIDEVDKVTKAGPNGGNSNPANDPANTNPVNNPTEDPASTPEDNPSSNTFPEGDPLVSGDDTPMDDQKDPANDPSSDEITGPGVDNQPDFGDNGVQSIPKKGWVDAKEPAVWQVFDVEPYPNALPEKPVALEDPNYMPWTSGRQVAVRGESLYAVDSNNGSLVVFNRLSGKVERIIAVGDRPEQVVVAPDGTAFVTVRWSGTVVKIGAHAMQVSQVVKIGTEPFGLALSADAKTVYVSISGENRLVALRAQDMVPVGGIETPLRPRSVATTPNGRVFVSQQFGSVLRVDTNPFTGGPVTSKDLSLRTANPHDDVMQPGKSAKNVATRAVGMTVNPQTEEVYATHVEAQPGSSSQSLTDLLATPPETTQECNDSCEDKCTTSCKNKGGYGGGTVCGTSCGNSCITSCVTKILTFPHLIRPIEATASTFEKGSDQPKLTQESAPVKCKTTGLPMTALIDKPWDINHHPTMSMAFMVGKGTDNVLVLNTASGDLMRSPIAEIKVGHAPTAVTFSEDGQTAYVLNRQSFTVSQIDLAPLFNMASISPANAPNPGFGMQQFPSGATLTDPIQMVHQKELIYGNDTLPDDQKLGRRIFTFSRFKNLAAKGFFSCSTCHFEGTEDKLIWFVKEGPRQTPILAGRLQGTEPFNWMGSAETLIQNFNNTVKRMGGAGLQEDELESLQKFVFNDVNGLVLPPNPNIEENGLTSSQKNGQLLFYNPAVGCAKCHVGKTFEDGENWDVGTFTELEIKVQETKEGSAEKLVLNTPSLSGLFYSAPYLHDGSAPTLYEVLNKTAASMGMTITLTGQQQTDLVNYLLTL